MAIPPIYCYISSSTGNDANDGRTAGAPLATLARARALYGGNRSQDRIFRFACGDVWREVAGGFTVTNGFRATYESYELSPGDTDLLGRPRLSAGFVLTGWTASSGNWYSTDVVPPSAATYLILMQNFEVLRRRDARVGRRGVFTGSFTPGTLEEGEWAYEVATGRIWMGSDPAAGTVEISHVLDLNNGPLRFAGSPNNVTVRELWIGCASQGLVIGDGVIGQRRNLVIEDMELTGFANNAMLVGGGDNVLMRRIRCYFAHNNMIIFNKGIQGNLLIEDCDLEGGESFGTGPNGYYDDRGNNDVLTLHSEGGSNVTVRRVQGRFAVENAFDVLEGFDLVRMEDCDFWGAGSHVAQLNAKTQCFNSRFYDSGRGILLKFQATVGVTPNAAGSLFEHCLIVGNGNPARGDAGANSGIQLGGVDATADPVFVRRSVVASHPSAARQLVYLSTLSYLGTPYTAKGLRFEDSILDHRATGSTPLIQIGEASSGHTVDAVSLVRTTLQYSGSVSPVTLNGTAYSTDDFLALPANETSAFASVAWPTENPTEPEDFVPGLSDNLPLGLLDLGPASALLTTDVNAVTLP